MTNSYYLKPTELKKKKFLKIGRNCKISNLVTFIGEKNISLGNNVRIDDFCIINGFEGFVVIGDDTHISSFCYLLGAAGISIGKNCDISQGVKIYSKSDDYKKIIKKRIYKKINISNNVIIGSNSILLPGSTLGANSRVGALTIVNKIIKKNTLFYGKVEKKIS